MSTIAFFDLVFGRRPTDDEVRALGAMFPDGCVRSAADAHRLLAGFDAQSHPTAFGVRATQQSLSRCDLDTFVLWLDNDDPSVSAVIADRRAYEPHVSEALREELKAGSTFVDVGANVGFHTFLAASIVGPGGAVVAVEPMSENCRLLQLSQIDNQADHVRILPVALDRTPGVCHIGAHIGTNAGLLSSSRDDLVSGRGSMIFAMTLDDIAPPRIDLLKVDVEGAEFRVLDGGRKTLERDRPVVVMEFSREMSERVSQVDPGEALAELIGLGYRLHRLDRDTCQRIPYASAAALLAELGDPLRIEDLLLQPA